MDLACRHGRGCFGFVGMDVVKESQCKINEVQIFVFGSFNNVKNGLDDEERYLVFKL